MNIPIEKYEEIKEMIKEINMEDYSTVEKFQEEFKRYTGLTVFIAEDGVMEIENLDFKDLDELYNYFNIEEIIDFRYYNRLLKLVESIETREDFCEEATKMTGIQVKQFGTVVRLNNTDFAKKSDLAEYLRAYKIFDKIESMVCNFEVSENGRGVRLDGVAYVHDMKHTMNMYPQEDYPIEGYIKNGEIVWDKVDKNAFKLHKSANGSVYILRDLSVLDIKTIYYREPKEFGYVKKPYPIAILDKNRYCFMFKS